VYAFFLERVRANVHVVLCLSPVGETFRERCRMFPGLVNCTTIDWFTEWPADALYEVAGRQLGEEAGVITPQVGAAEAARCSLLVAIPPGPRVAAVEQLLQALVRMALPEARVQAELMKPPIAPHPRPLPTPNQQVKDDLCRVFVAAHQAVEDTSRRMWQQVKRRNYVTPTSYLEAVRGYRALLLEKLGALRGKADKLRGGLTKLEETAEQVGGLLDGAAERPGAPVVLRVQSKAAGAELKCAAIRARHADGAVASACLTGDGNAGCGRGQAGGGGAGQGGLRGAAGADRAGQAGRRRAGAAGAHRRPRAVQGHPA
jgi:hypothetical protein